MTCEVLFLRTHYERTKDYISQKDILVLLAPKPCTA